MSLSTKIIYGTAWKKEQTTALVVAAICNGFKAIDTACQPKHYREDLVGAALLELKAKHNIKREDIFLQTKYTPIGGQDASKPLPYNPSDPISTQILTSHQTSLSNLHTTYIDSYLLHSPLPTIEQTLEAWHTLMKLQDEGKVRMIGVSNTYDVRILAALQKARKVQVVQNRWYEGNGWDHAVLNYCREHDIMYQSFWTLTGSPSLLSHPSLIRIASASNMTPAQVVYKLSQEADVTPLSGTTNQQHMIEDVAVENSTFAEGMETRLKEVKSFVFDNAGIDSTV
ncbi:NADP-dependent oxidoreductase domain-containing protein [Panaeolus papilionaceus]|nr:NADP-dependent oxidoreductase domain-containing protein [Panaeolus papilionaceus]